MAEPQVKVYKHIGGRVDIRRFEVSPQGDFTALLDKLVRAYKVEPTSFLVYWKDSEGEFVSIESNEEMSVVAKAAKDALQKLFIVDASGKHVTEVFGEPTATKQGDSEHKHSEATARGGVHHPFVTCDGCNSAIYGRRFKCLECADYDLCERCELEFNRHPEHNMVLIRRPSPTGCPFMFAGRERVPGCTPTAYPGCPMFGGHGRGPRCGRFRCPPQSSQPNQPDTGASATEEDALQMRFADLLRDARNGKLPEVVAAVNEVLRPLGADLSVFVDPATRRDSSAATERSAGNADSGEQVGVPFGSSSSSEQSSQAHPSTKTASEQAGVPLGSNNEQASEARPSTSTAAVETRVETNDKPTSTESQVPMKPVGIQTPNAAFPYPEQLKSLKEMGFDNDNGWLEQLLIAKHGNVLQALDTLMGK